jgi:ATP-dependent exoDNAse (exonuclease V) beta subunit
MTRAIDRLIVSGAIDPEKRADADTPIGWVLGRLEADELDEAEHGIVEIVREGARLLVRLDRHRAEPAAPLEQAAVAQDGQLELFAPSDVARMPPPAPRLPELAPVPEPPLHRVRSLSYSALALFDRCSYRYYAERVVGMRPADARGAIPGQAGLAATELGDAVHVLLETDAPLEEVRERVLARYPAASEDDLERVTALVSAWHESPLARALAAEGGSRVELPFAFEHDGVLLHGRFDLFRLVDGRALVVDYKTNRLEELTPEQAVEGDYALQRLVYALAAFRAGAGEVEVAYVFLERPGEPVTRTFIRAELPELEAELSAAVADIYAGRFVPTPGELACPGCPALDVVCAGPQLSGFAAA